MKPEVYAKAMIDLESEGKQASAIVGGVKSSLQSRGALTLLPRVLLAYKALLSKGSAAGSVLTIARESDKVSALKDSGAKEGAVVKIDDGLIGGYRLESNGKLVDASYKEQLLQVYRNATAA